MAKVFTPRGYQELTTTHILEHQRCAVFCPMGGGKTVSVLNAIDALYLAGETHPTLIAAPLRVARDTWTDEARKWKHLSGLEVMPIVGTESERRLALKHDVPAYTVNYENMNWLINYWGDKWPYRTVVADESTKLKSFRGGFRTSKLGKVYLQTSKTDNGADTRSGALATMAWHRIQRFIELTGTPSPNGLKDLWGQMWFLDQGQRLGRTYEAFKQRWFEKEYDGYSIVARQHAQDEIQGLIKDICITIDIKDWIDIKEPVISNIYVDLPVKARAQYREMEKKMFLEIEDRTVEAFNAAAKTSKLLQLAGGAVYVDPEAEGDSDPRAKEWRMVHDAKMEALADVIEEAGGAPVIAVYNFRSDLARMKKAYPHGLTLSNASELTEFKKGKSPIGFAHPASLGHGIDGLQDVCNMMVFFGRGWNIEEYDQLCGRIGPVRQHQSGLDRPVFIWHIIARGTLDEEVDERHASKRSVQDILLAAMKRRK